MFLYKDDVDLVIERLFFNSDTNFVGFFVVSTLKLSKNGELLKIKVVSNGVRFQHATDFVH